MSPGRASGRLRRLVSRFGESVSTHLPGNVVGNRILWVLINAAGGRAVWPLHTDPDVWVRALHGLSAGAGLIVSRGTVINCAGGVTFGEDCLIGYGVYIGSAGHSIPPSISERIADAGHEHAAVALGDGCWVGAHASILPGVTLGDGCVVGAGAVVTRSYGPGSVLVGVPAEVMRVRDIPEDPERADGRR